MSRTVTGPTFVCVRCLEPETVVLRNALNMCFDCLYPKCVLCGWKHSEVVGCDPHKRSNRPRRGRHCKRSHEALRSHGPVMPIGTKRRQAALSYIMQRYEERRGKR